MWVLARAVDISVPQSNVGKAIFNVVEIEIVLPRPLTHPIGTDRTSQVFLVSGKSFLLAIDRSSGRSENEFLDFRLTRTFKDVEHPQNIHARVIEGIGNRTADVHLCRMMVHDLDLFRHDQLADGRVLDIGLHEASLRMQVLSFASREIIDHEDAVASLYIGIDDM